VLTVYSSLPRSGVSASQAEAVAAGERLALADAHGRAAGRRVRLVELDSTARGGESWDPGAVEANARRAVRDRSAIAYLGELDFGGSAVSVPVTSAARLLQVSPADGLTSLTAVDPADPEAVPERYYPRGRRNFVRLVPTDAQQAEALISWARAGGARRIAVIRDDRLFGRALAGDVAAAARRQGVAVASAEEARRGASDYRALARDVAAAKPDAVVYTGFGGASADRTLIAIDRALAHPPVYGSSGLAAAPAGPRSVPAGDVLKAMGPASSYGERARGVLRRLRAQRGDPAAPEALLGYDAMELVLDALAAAGADAGERAAVTRAALRGGALSRPLANPDPAAGAEARTATFAAYRRAGGRLRFLGFRSAPGLPPRTP